MGGGVSSLPAEVSLAEAQRAGGRQGSPRGRRTSRTRDAKISRDEAMKCWKDAEAKAAISEELYEKLHARPLRRGGSAGLFGHNCEKRGQHLPGTREWVFEAVGRHRMGENVRIAKLFWLVGGGGTGKSVAAAELLARLLDKAERRGVAFLQAHRAGENRASGTPAVSGGHAVRDGGGLRGRAEGERGRRDGQGRRSSSRRIAEPLQNVEAPRGADEHRVNCRRARRAAARRAEAGAVVARERTQDAPKIKGAVTSRDEAQIKAALKGYRPSELRVDEARNRQDVRALHDGAGRNTSSSR